jgi:hypothetical protein
MSLVPHWVVEHNATGETIFFPALVKMTKIILGCMTKNVKCTLKYV